jgi:hypothetical protein
MKRFLEHLSGVDTRALAVFRVGLGLILLLDLLVRSRSAELHYSAAGVLPLDELDRLYLRSPWWWTLHGSLADPRLLFGVAAVAAVALVAGWRTRMATGLSWLLVTSLHARNPMLLFGGDHLLRMLLFWSLFLPLGAVWSVDARRRTEGSAGPHASVASGAILVQVALMYGFTGYFKLNEAWLNGGALQAALGSEMFARPIAQGLVPHLDGVSWLGPLVPLLEISGAVLLLASGAAPRLRLAVVLAMGCFHLLVFGLLETGLFQVLALTALVLFLPSPFWDRVGPRQARPAGHSRGSLALAAETLAALLLVHVITWNVLSVTAVPFARDHLFLWVAEQSGEGRSPRLMLPGYAVERRLGDWGWPGRALGLYQRWDMFQEGGGSTDRWHMVIGTLASGQRISLLEGGLPFEGDAHARPDCISSLYPDTRWRTHLRYLITSEAARQHLAQPLADHWNRGNPEREIEEIEVLLVEEPALRAGDLASRRSITWVRSAVSPPP